MSERLLAVVVLGLLLLTAATALGQSIDSAESDNLNKSQADDLRQLYGGALEFSAPLLLLFGVSVVLIAVRGFS